MARWRLHASPQPRHAPVARAAGLTVRPSLLLPACSVQSLKWRRGVSQQSLLSGGTAALLCSAAARRWTLLPWTLCLLQLPAVSSSQVGGGGRVGRVSTTGPVPDQAHTDVRLAVPRSLPAGDYSRTPGGSDSQVIRTAILVDEVLAQQAAAAQARGAAGSAPPVVVAQVRSTGAQATARFACGGRVHTVPTKQMNAARMARLIQMPATAAVYRSLSDWGSSAHLAVRPLPPQLAGLTVEQLQLHLPNSVLLGLDRPSSSGTGEEGSPGQGRQLQAPSHGGRDGGMQLNPPADAVVLPGDSLVLLCGQHLDVAMQPLPADEEGDWAPQQLGNSDGAGSWLGAVPPRASITVPESHGQVHLTQSWSVGEGSSGSHLGGGSSGDAHSGAAPAEYRLPQQYLGAARQPQRLLLCGYSDPDLMLALFCALDKGPQVCGKTGRWGRGRWHTHQS